jgi:hypothetical protein
MNEIGRYFDLGRVEYERLLGVRFRRMDEWVGGEFHEDVVFVLMELESIGLSREELVGLCQVWGPAGCRVWYCAGADNEDVNAVKAFGLVELQSRRSGLVERVGDFSVLGVADVPDCLIMGDRK